MNLHKHNLGGGVGCTNTTLILDNVFEGYTGNEFLT